MDIVKKPGTNIKGIFYSKVYDVKEHYEVDKGYGLHADNPNGWYKEYSDRVVFYPKTSWEPIREWVTINIKEDDWNNLLWASDHMNQKPPYYKRVRDDDR